MYKLNMREIIQTVIASIVAALILAGAAKLFYIPRLQDKVERLETEYSDLLKQVRDLQQTTSNIKGYLYGKLGYNPSVLVESAKKKGLSQSAIREATKVLDKISKPEEAKTYLMKEWGFTSTEAQNVLSKP